MSFIKDIFGGGTPPPPPPPAAPPHPPTTANASVQLAGEQAAAAAAAASGQGFADTLKTNPTLGAPKPNLADQTGGAASLGG
jgi:hypothetical protein